ncbi:hypothetical protein Acor_24240 [Acrocarpospora corrugata]|uniref:Uncharacterized protein n=2 Tax=Acrocarpospora corrugata TaxID=35763 RepID=A0A5M3VWM7_9ACTN|nr:hypothetical protein Acor_24240 [Acrocarpospora corrugata]
MVLGGAAVAVGAVLMVPVAASAQQAPAPATVAKQLFKAWLKNDKVAAGKVATPGAVKSIFAYSFKAPDKFAGCSGNYCRFVHTSVNVPGDLNGLGMVVTGNKVTRVYRSRHASPATVTKYFHQSYVLGDRRRALEVATKVAVDKRFQVAYDPDGVTHFYQGCSKEPKGYSCAYSYEGGAVFMHVRGSKARGYEVASISFIAD